MQSAIDRASPHDTATLAICDRMTTLRTYPCPDIGNMKNPKEHSRPPGGWNRRGFSPSAGPLVHKLEHSGAIRICTGQTGERDFGMGLLTRSSSKPAKAR